MATTKPAKTEDQTIKQGFSGSVSIDSLDDIARAADMIYKSGAFGKLNNAEEAGAKIMTGAELGISPMTAVRNIYFFDGSVTISGPLLAALIREHPRYDYKILGANQEGAKVRFFRRERSGEGKMIWKKQTPDVAFTREMAQKAGLLSKQNWQDYPEDMYVWRCIARGKRWHCPEVGKGTLYIPDEAKHGVVEDVEPIEETVQQGAPPSGGDSPDVGGLPEPTPDHDGKGDTDPETKPGGPAQPEGTPNPDEESEEQAEDDPAPSTKESGTYPGSELEDRRKPIPTDEDGEYVPGGTEGHESSPENTKPTSQMEPAEDRKAALIPSFVDVNVAAITPEAAQKARSIHGTLRTMEAGNSLLTSIKSYREEVIEAYPSKADADGVMLKEILDHHLKRIGSKPTPETEPQEEAPDPEEEQPDNSADLVWLDSIGHRFRNDMEETAQILEEAVEKGGISPLNERISKLRARFSDAGTTTEMKREFDKVLAPYETILSMREALTGGDNPRVEVFNRSLNSFLEKTEDWSPPKRVNRAREIVTREARRLEAQFDSLSLEVEEENASEDRSEGEPAEGNVSGSEEARPEEGESPSSGKSAGNSGKENHWAPDIPIPPGFPKKKRLEEAGILRTSVVMDKIRDETLTEVKGIGPASVDKIREYLRQIAD